MHILKLIKIYSFNDKSHVVYVPIKTKRKMAMKVVVTSRQHLNSDVI